MVRSLMLLLVSSGAVLVGCSGAPSTELLGPVGTETSSTDPEPSGSASATGPRAPTAGSAASGAGASASPAPPGERAACAVEVEPNDVPAVATTFTACIGGKLANARDVDVLRIVAPAGARRMTVKHTDANGRIVYRVTEESGLPLVGTDETLEDEDASGIAVRPGASYLFHLSTRKDGNGARPYDLEVAFE